MSPGAQEGITSGAPEEVGQAVVMADEDMQRKRLLMQYNKFKVLAASFNKVSGHFEHGSLDAALKALESMTKELINTCNWGRKLNAIEDTLLTDQMNYMILVEDQRAVTSQTQTAIKQQKADLKQARRIQQWNQECEELRHETMAYPIKSGILSDCQQLEQYFLKLDADNGVLDTKLGVSTSVKKSEEIENNYFKVGVAVAPAPFLSAVCYIISALDSWK